MKLSLISTKSLNALNRTVFVVLLILFNSPLETASAGIGSTASTTCNPVSVEPDGKVVRPRNYKGSLEESAQEAIIIFDRSNNQGEATEDLILKIQVKGEAENFAWIVPFPNEPKVAKEDPKLFKELFQYVEARKASQRNKKKKGFKSLGGFGGGGADSKVEVLQRKTVGDFEIAVVKENEQGGLNPWLKKEGFETLDDAEDVLEFYRKKKYCFACIKVDSKVLAEKKEIESHPLRFTFKTGGRDGIYFPMKLTSLQKDAFDVNLYVFTDSWVNAKLSKYGFRHRGFELSYRDWDTSRCRPNVGKTWSLPEEDPFLKGMAHKIPTVKKLFQKLHPGQFYYMTNLYASKMKPEDVRHWKSDLWMFPYYTNRKMVPYDVRKGGPAADAYSRVEFDLEEMETERLAESVWVTTKGPISVSSSWWGYQQLLIVSLICLGGVFVARFLFKKRNSDYSKTRIGSFNKPLK